MSGRDLLYKPRTPIVAPDEKDDERGDALRRAGLARKVGVQPQSRDLGGTQTAVEAPKVRATDPATAATPAAETLPLPQPQPQPQPLPRTAAYQNPYFNRDVNAARAANQATSGMRALRGEEVAVDLDRVVLPGSPTGVDVPNPGHLLDASGLMGLDGQFDLDLQSLVARQSGWTQEKGVTVELLEQRMALLESMIEARRAALARMRALSTGERTQSETVRIATEADGNALEGVNDLATEGTALVGRTLVRATGMHRRLAKILGFKIT